LTRNSNCQWVPGRFSAGQMEASLSLLALPLEATPSRGILGAHMRQVELRSLLTAARARLRPQDVGLPVTAHRRVPGLRREDVAELVGVTPNWSAAFENGSTDRNFSPAFVQRVAEALRLDEGERVRLLRLVLPEVTAAASHYESILASTEGLLREARSIAGRAVAQNICQRLISAESLREARAAGGLALASAICRQIAARIRPR
jgi:transcriptional regulator with XRE-family HTH domain